MADYFRVGTFNVFNLVNEGVRYYSSAAYSHEEFRKKAIWIGQQLDDMDAEIVGFQEVFHQQAITQCLRESRKLNTATPVVFGTDESSDPTMTPVVALATVRQPL